MTNLTKDAQSISQFWQTGTFASFEGVDGVRINYALFQQSENNKCLLIVPGRSEGYLKYQELVFDLAAQGFNLALIDHRGQGISGRLLANRHKGFVKRFSDYADDLKSFIHQHLPDACKKNLYLLAHSMGGAISATYLQATPDTPVKAAILSSPMLGIHTGGLPDWLAKTVVKSGNWLNHKTSQSYWYFFGQSDYKAPKFNDNVLSHSQPRFDTFVDLYREKPELQLGGVTFHWLAQSIKQTEALLNNQSSIKVPVLVLQAEQDTVVDNAAQDKYCQRLVEANPLSCREGKPVILPGARHEILFETDDIRDQAIRHITDWIARFSS